jgi:hypothetical protein
VVGPAGTNHQTLVFEKTCDFAFAFERPGDFALAGNPWWLVRPGPTTEPSYLNGQGGRPTTNTPPVFRETSVVGPAGTNHRTPPKEPTTTLDPALKHNLLVVGGPFGGVRWLARPGPTTEVSLKTGGVLVVGRPPKRTNNHPELI